MTVAPFFVLVFSLGKNHPQNWQFDPWNCWCVQGWKVVFQTQIHAGIFLKGWSFNTSNLSLHVGLSTLLIDMYGWYTKLEGEVKYKKYIEIQV